MNTQTETHQNTDSGQRGYTARTLAEALLALPDPDQPMIAYDSWTTNCPQPCTGFEHSPVPLTNLVIDKEGISIDEGEPTYCAGRRCDCAGKHEHEGALYCATCYKRKTTDHKAVKEQEVREAARVLAHRQKQLDEMGGGGDRNGVPLSVEALENWLATDET